MALNPPGVLACSGYSRYESMILFSKGNMAGSNVSRTPTALDLILDQIPQFGFLKSLGVIFPISVPYWIQELGS